MTFKIKTTVRASNGLVFDISFKTNSAEALSRYADTLLAAGFRPVEQPLQPDASENNQESISTDNLDSTDHTTQATPSRANGDLTPPTPSSVKMKVNITKISIHAVQRGQNIGNPKWFIDTDDNIQFCIFRLDKFISGRYITRQTAMSEAWRTLGSEIVIDPPLPATIEKDGKWWELILVSPSQEHIDKLYPPKEFVPANIVEIVDVEMQRIKGFRNRVLWHGKTDDLDQEIIISQQHREHIHGIGVDTSTWDLPEPYTKSVTLNIKDNKPTHAMNQDGVWTEARHHQSLLNGEIICRRNQDGDIHYLVINKIENRANNGPSTITFEGDHPPVEDTFDTFYVCLTPIPQAALGEEIPF